MVKLYNFSESMIS